MRPLELLHVDRDLLVVHKPAGLLSVPTPGVRARSLVDALADLGHAVLPVHRLDREVTGCVLFALNEPTRAALEELFRARALRKLYWALALGHLGRSQGEYRDPILDEGSYARVSARGKKCTTRWSVTVEHAAASEVEIELVTGRYNQIRVHFAHRGHPLVGERKYARGREDPFRFRRVALHAAHLEFAHPRSGEVLSIAAPLPDDLRELVRRAGEAR